MAKALHHRRQHVHLADHAAIEQGQARDGHHQHQRGRGQHPGGVAAIERRRRGGVGRRLLRERNCRTRVIGGGRRSSEGHASKNLSESSGVSLQCFFVSVAGADAHGLHHVEHEDLAVTDASGGGRLGSCRRRGRPCRWTRRSRSSPSARSSRRIRRRDRFRCGPFAGRKPLASVTVIPWMPMEVSASRTSSSLNGLITAMMNFITRSSTLHLRFSPRPRPFAAAGICGRADTSLCGVPMG